MSQVIEKVKAWASKYKSKCQNTSSYNNLMTDPAGPIISNIQNGDSIDPTFSSNQGIIKFVLAGTCTRSVLYIDI